MRNWPYSLYLLRLCNGFLYHFHSLFWSLLVIHHSRVHFLDVCLFELSMLYLSVRNCLYCCFCSSLTYFYLVIVLLWVIASICSRFFGILLYIPLLPGLSTACSYPLWLLPYLQPPLTQQKLSSIDGKLTTLVRVYLEAPIDTLRTGNAPQPPTPPKAKQRRTYDLRGLQSRRTSFAY